MTVKNLIRPETGAKPSGRPSWRRRDTWPEFSDQNHSEPLPPCSEYSSGPAEQKDRDWSPNFSDPSNFSDSVDGFNSISLDPLITPTNDPAPFLGVYYQDGEDLHGSDPFLARSDQVEDPLRSDPFLDFSRRRSSQGDSNPFLATGDDPFRSNDPFSQPQHSTGTDRVSGANLFPESDCFFSGSSDLKSFTVSESNLFSASNFDPFCAGVVGGGVSADWPGRPGAEAEVWPLLKAEDNPLEANTEEEPTLEAFMEKLTIYKSEKVSKSDM